MTSLSGHIDTIRPLLLPQKKQFAATSEVFPLHDGDFLTLHYLQPIPPQPQGLLLILPGMASNRNAPIIMAATRTLLTQNFSPVIAELRNCSDMPGKTPKFFNAGSVADLTELGDYLCEKTGRPLSAIIGFSLGANILIQWAARNTNARQQTHFIHCRITNSLNDPLIPGFGLYSSIHRRLGLELNIIPYGGHLGLLHTSIFRKAKHFFTSDVNSTKTLL